MTAGIITESAPHERRVALVPSALSVLTKTGVDLLMESGAGAQAGFPDSEYAEKGVRIAPSREAVFAAADVILAVRAPGANPETGAADLALLRRGQTLIGFGEPLTALDAARVLAAQGVTFLAMELMPRITRAQSMDALSSMATISGYRAVLLGATELPKIFPMLMTAAGTITPAKVFIMGVGVAGLQAIATARRLGAVVSATDVRPATKEQVASLGAKFIAVEDEEFKQAQTATGYAKPMSAEYQKKQAELVASHIKNQDIVITTALIPGRPAPRLITTAMVESMKPGSVIIDLAAEQGGNCELTVADRVVDHGGVKIVGYTDYASRLPTTASQLYGTNLVHL